MHVVFSTDHESSIDVNWAETSDTFGGHQKQRLPAWMQVTRGSKEAPSQMVSRPATDTSPSAIVGDILKDFRRLVMLRLA